MRFSRAHYRFYGVRNVSELARLALQRIINGPVRPSNRFRGEVVRVG